MKLVWKTVKGFSHFFVKVENIVESGQKIMLEYVKDLLLA